MKKEKLFMCITALTALLLTSCSGILTAYKNSFYSGTKLPGETLEVGDLIFSDCSAIAYTEYTWSAMGDYPKGVVYSVENGKVLCLNFDGASLYFQTLEGFYPDNFSISPVNFYPDGYNGEIKTATAHFPSEEDCTAIYKNKNMVDAILKALPRNGLTDYTNCEESLTRDYYIDSSWEEHTGDDTYYTYKTFSFDDGTASDQSTQDLEHSYSWPDVKLLTVFEYNVAQ